MRNSAQKPSLSALRAAIAAIEKRPPLAGEAVAAGGPRDRMGWEALLAPPPGLLHDIHADETRNAGAAFGFALGLARGLLSPKRPALLVLQLSHESQDLGLPYGAGLLGFGLAPEALVLGRLATLAELLWAIEEAVACRAVAGVVAEVLGAPKALDFTASRRLALRAASGGASVFLLRHGALREASAARLRWRIEPAPSQPPRFDAAAPGAPRWRVTLEKTASRQRPPAGGDTILVDWTEHGFAPASADSTEMGGHGRAGPALAGAHPAALGDRLSAAS